MNRVWTWWDWRSDPDAPRGWSGTQRVVIVDGLEGAGAPPPPAAWALSHYIVDKTKRTPVVVWNDVASTWRYVDGDYESWFIPALRIERQVDITAENLAPLLSVRAPHRALFVCPREEIDMGRVVGRGSYSGCVAGGCVDIDGMSWHPLQATKPRPDLVIVAAATGQDAWPVSPRWVRKIRDDCKAAHVAFAFLGWGPWVPLAGGPGQTRVVDGCEFTFKGRIGYDQRLLDGQEHLELPEGL